MKTKYFGKGHSGEKKKKRDLTLFVCIFAQISLWIILSMQANYFEWML